MVTPIKMSDFALRALGSIRGNARPRIYSWDIEILRMSQNSGSVTASAVFFATDDGSS